MNKYAWAVLCVVAYCSFTIAGDREYAHAALALRNRPPRVIRQQPKVEKPPVPAAQPVVAEPVQEFYQQPVRYYRSSRRSSGGC